MLAINNWHYHTQRAVTIHYIATVTIATVSSVERVFNLEFYWSSDARIKLFEKVNFLKCS